MGGEALRHLRAPIEDRTQAVSLGLEHLEELSPPGEERVERVGLGVGQRADLGADPLGEEGEEVRVEAIGLGELARGFGKVPHLARIDHHDGEAGGGEGGDTDQLIAAGGLEHDELGPQRSQALDQLADAGLIVGDGPALARRSRGHDQFGFRDIDPSPHRVPPQERETPGPCLVHIRARRMRRPPQLFGLWQREIRVAAPANARC